MIKEFVEAWDKNKDKLMEYFKTHSQEEYSQYQDLVKLLFNIVINPVLWEEKREKFDISNMKIIDDGNYDGTLIFILLKAGFYYTTEGYIYTSVNYGSCPGCDTLQHIQSWDLKELPNEEQIKDYMTLTLHLLQRCHYMKGE